MNQARRRTSRCLAFEGGYDMKQTRAPASVVKILGVWHFTERFIAVAAFSLIGLLLFADVAGREVIGPLGRALGLDSGPAGIAYSRKIALAALVLGAFAGLGVSVATGAQIVPRVAFGWVPERWGPALDRLANLVSGILFLAVAYYGVIFVLSSREIGTVAAGIGWPLWIIQAFIPAGFASAGCRYLVFAIWPDTAPRQSEVQE